MNTASKPDAADMDNASKRAYSPRLDTPNRPVAIGCFVYNIFKEAILHPRSTSYIDRRTGRFIGRSSTDDKPKRDQIRRFDSPNLPVAIVRYVFNTFKESLLHPTVTSTLDMRTGKVVARDGKRLD